MSIPAIQASSLILYIPLSLCPPLPLYDPSPCPCELRLSPPLYNPPAPGSRYGDDGKKTRYFADDDNVDLATLVKRAKCVRGGMEEIRVCVYWGGEELLEDINSLHLSTATCMMTVVGGEAFMYD